MTSTWEIRPGDCVEVMRNLTDCSIDAVVTDPPYDLTAGKKGGTGLASINLAMPHGRARIGAGNGGFMGKDWDATGVAFDPATWAEALRLLKPGGHVLAFGGTRTFHRMTCAIEDAGFEIRDCLSWLYGSGFPKSLNLDGDWQGWGTALKPSWEPIVLARKPLVGTVAATVSAHGTGALHIDAVRVGDDTARGDRYGDAAPGGGDGAILQGPKQEERWEVPAGRWPANVVLDEAAAIALDAQTAHLHAAGNKPGSLGNEPAGKTSIFGIGWDGPASVFNDSGGASRFFYCAKASTAERNAGLDERVDHRRANTHPTVKPIELMRWLVRLVTPPGGSVLDPFAGSGTTGIAALREGFSFIGIERQAEYVDIARARILGDAPLLNSMAEVAA